VATACRQGTAARWSKEVLVDPAWRGECQECAAIMPGPWDPPEQWLSEEGTTMMVLQRHGGAPVSGR
jgi:hypothetical protein